MKHILVAAVALLVGSPALAETLRFTTELNGSNQVPPVNTQGKGSITATFDTGTKQLTWRGAVANLSGDVTAAHFHGPAEPGKNAPVLIPAPGVKNGSFEGTITVTDEQAKHLTAGHTYFNIHTAANPQGEVRGQVTKAQ